jgi:hypothetical protein
VKGLETGIILNWKLKIKEFGKEGKEGENITSI